MSAVTGPLDSAFQVTGGRGPEITIPGELIIASPVDDISVNFQYGISNSDVRDGGAVTGTGTIGTLKAMAAASTGTGVGSATLESVDAVRYRAGHYTRCALSVLFAAGTADVNQYAGWLNDEDGFSFGYQGETFGAWFIEGGNFNFVAQTDFNVDVLDKALAASDDSKQNPSGYTINPQTANLYRISYAWHGFLPAVFEVWTGYFTGWQVCHVFEFTNTATETHLENPNLPVSCKIERTTGTGSDLKMYTGSWRGGVIAGREEDNSSNRWFADFVVERTVGDGFFHLITLRSKDLYQSKNNHIRTDVKILVSTNNTNKDCVFRATRIAALDAADQAAIEAGFADIDTNDSVIESSGAVRIMTTTVTDAITGDVAVVPRSGQRDNLNVQGFTLYPGDDVVFLIEAAGSGTASFQLNFVEYH